jgi:hypothetical protein
MRPLKVEAFKVDFERKPHDDQKELLVALIETEVGKEVKDEIIYNYRVEQMMKWFNGGIPWGNRMSPVYPNVLHLLKSSVTAQRHLVEIGMYDNNFYSEVNAVLSDWLGDVDRGHRTIKFISKDKSTICIVDWFIFGEQEVGEIEVEGVKLYRDDDFNFTSYICSDMLNSDKVYIHTGLHGNHRMKSLLWYKLYEPGDF